MTYVRSALLLILLFLTPIAQSAQKLTITAGGADLRSQPVAVALPASSNLEPGAYWLTWELADSRGEPAQVERTRDGVIVRWIEPALDAGKSKNYDIGPKLEKPESFKLVDGDGKRDLVFGATPVWRDMIKYDPADRENTYKPYKHVYDFQGKEFITKGPGGLYTHHRGIFFGFKAFDGQTLLGDFWHCPDVTEQHVKYLPEREFVGPVAARVAQVIDWVGKDGKPVVRDTREFTTWRISPKSYVIDCDIMVETLIGKPVRLDADPHHAGLHFRAAQAVAKDVKGTAGNATYIRPATAVKVKDDIYSNCAWVHCSFDIDGHHYQLTHMDGPDNPRPTEYSTRPYGRVGAFFTAEVTPDKPLKVRYRLALSEGDVPTAGQLEVASRAYISPVQVKP